MLSEKVFLLLEAPIKDRSHETANPPGWRAAGNKLVPVRGGRPCASRYEIRIAAPDPASR